MILARDRLYDYVIPLMLAAPLAMLCGIIIQEGILSDTLARFMSSALILADRGLFGRPGFQLPPLPLLLLLGNPVFAFAAELGALSIGAVTYLLAKRAIVHHDRIRLIGLLALVLSPAAIFLAVVRFDEAIALWLFYLAWLKYDRWRQSGITLHGFWAGLILGVAALVTPLALPVALLFGAALPLFHSQPPRAYLTGSLVLAFPSIAVILSWAFLSWIFTGNTVWLYTTMQDGTNSLMLILRFSPLYITVGAILIFRRTLKLLAYMTPLLLLALISLLDWQISIYFAVLFLGIFAIEGMRDTYPLWAKGLFLIACVAQTILLWIALPWPAPLGALPQEHVVQVIPARPVQQSGFVSNLMSLMPSQQHSGSALYNEQRVGSALSGFSGRQILTDDQTSFRLITRAGTARPFLLPSDPGYGLAFLHPAQYVEAILTCEGSVLHARYGRRVPSGFTAAWSDGECRFYRRG